MDDSKPIIRNGIAILFMSYIFLTVLLCNTRLTGEITETVTGKTYIPIMNPADCNAEHYRGISHAPKSGIQDSLFE